MGNADHKKNINNLGAIILAAGKGVRFGSQKQFLQIDGEPLWRIVQSKISKFVLSTNIVTVGIDVPGGTTRSESVRIGLSALENRGISQIIIAEAARPLVTPEQIELLIKKSGISKTFVKPLVNTVIWRDKTYIDREKLMELLTPQCFDFDMLKQAYDGEEFIDETDDTRVFFNHHGAQPEFIDGDSSLFKITYPIDLHVVNCLYKDS